MVKSPLARLEISLIEPFHFLKRSDLIFNFPAHGFWETRSVASAMPHRLFSALSQRTLRPQRLCVRSQTRNLGSMVKSPLARLEISLIEPFHFLKRSDLIFNFPAHGFWETRSVASAMLEITTEYTEFSVEGASRDHEMIGKSAATFWDATRGNTTAYSLPPSRFSVIGRIASPPGARRIVSRVAPRVRSIIASWARCVSVLSR